MIIDTSCYPTNLVDLAWRHDGDPFTGERLLKMMDGPYTVNGKPRRIDRAFIQPPQGNTIHTWTDGEVASHDAVSNPYVPRRTAAAGAAPPEARARCGSVWQPAFRRTAAQPNKSIVKSH